MVPISFGSSAPTWMSTFAKMLPMAAMFAPWWLVSYWLWPRSLLFGRHAFAQRKTGDSNSQPLRVTGFKPACFPFAYLPCGPRSWGFARAVTLPLGCVSIRATMGVAVGWRVTLPLTSRGCETFSARGPRFTAARTIAGFLLPDGGIGSIPPPSVAAVTSYRACFPVAGEVVGHKKSRCA